MMDWGVQPCGADGRGDAVPVTVQFPALLGVVLSPDKFSGAAHRERRTGLNLSFTGTVTDFQEGSKSWCGHGAPLTQQ